MYNAYFGFKEAPFSIAPDPRYLYMTGQHREALAHLIYGLNSEGGCILLTGEVGTGKTTVCRCLLEQIPEQAHIALVLNPKVTAIELLETICDELKIVYPQQGNTVKTCIDLINRFLIEANARNEKTVLIIDEAQNLDSTVLEQLRLLTNLETNQRKLLQIIILGQPELLEILARKEMRQLAQRITARFHLNALSRNEVKAYVTHRLAVAGQNVQLFPEQIIRQLYRLSNGIPRLINILCDRALLGTYVQNKPSVDRLTLNTAAKEVFGELRSVENKKKWTSWTRVAALTATLLVAGLIVFSIVQQQDSDTGKQAASDASPAKNNTEALASTEPAAEDKTVSPVVVATVTTDATEPEAKLDIITVDDTAVTEAPISDTINALFTNQDSDNAEQAYSALFRLWNRNYPGSAGINACTFASNEELSCLHSRGNLNSLRKLNRPAVLRLYSDDGRIIHVTIKQLHQQHASIDAGEATFDVDIPQLENHWYGEYTLLWQKPPFYTEPLQPGSSGPVVQWLDQQLTRIYGQQSQPTIRDIYSDELVNSVKRFQQSKGLIPDGIAGPLTFIHLNSVSGTSAPELIVSDKPGS